MKYTANVSCTPEDATITTLQNENFFIGLRGTAYEVPPDYGYLFTRVYDDGREYDVYGCRRIVEEVVHSVLQSLAYTGRDIEVFKPDPPKPKIEDFTPMFGAAKCRDTFYKLT